ncbi:MAG: hypothetical protein HFI34_12295 [Lachnospiraceae bacterium]|nr:hypothetical protein [Lachnospiraceae bacterium]
MNDIKRLRQLEIIGILFVITTGTLAHFVYDWSGRQNIIGLFFAQNESTFEHLKLLFYPYLLYSVLEYCLLLHSSLTDYAQKLSCGKFFGLLAGLLSIITLFYTYTGVFGNSILAVDISIFILSVIISFMVSYYLISQETCLCRANPGVYLTLTGILIFYFLLFSIRPPEIPLFSPPKD